MNQEHGIDDILTLLKESVNDENWNQTNDGVTDVNASSASTVSLADLKQKLMQEYMGASKASSKEIEEDGDLGKETAILLSGTDEADETEISSLELSELLLNYESEQAEDFLNFDHSRTSNDFDRVDKITPSVFDLMLQCGCEEELDAMTDADTPSDLGDDEKLNLSKQEEAKQDFLKQSEALRYRFKNQKIYGVLQLLGMILLTIGLIFYEIMPVLRISTGGITDFRQYPGSYILLGLQLLLFCTLFLWKKLLNGAKRIFTNSPNIYSVFFVMIFGVALYDMSMIFISQSTLPPTFHSFIAVLLLYAKIVEFCMLWRNERVFFLFASFFDRDDVSKYTLAKSEGKDSLAEKIYQGGVDYSQNIYLPQRIKYPYDFEKNFGPMCFASGWMKWLLPCATIMSVISFMISTLLNRGWYGNALAAIMVFFVTLPLSALTATLVPMLISTKRLVRRGIALTSEDVMERYEKADMMVFSDFHLLQPCSAKDTGIYLYDKDQCAFLLSCLKRVYSIIGSPLAAIFSDLPDLCDIESIQILRITQGEMEVLIDKKHVLLLGDLEFMNRCGLRFPTDETPNDRASVCISLDGRVSAKLSVCYKIEQIFEMLAERLAKEGVHSVVETYDPMICAELIAVLRKAGTSPISVVHKNASDLTRSQCHKMRERESVGLFVYSSRLKLAEALVWCKRLRKSKRASEWLSFLFALIGLTVTALGLIFGWISGFYQYWLLLYMVLSNISILILSVVTLPRSDYFTKASFDRELQKNQSISKKENKKKFS